jgi:hypothetical protein
MMNTVKLSLHYSRAGGALSCVSPCAALLLLAACAQSPGQITAQAAKKTPNAPPLRAVAVIEWTGEENKPGEAPQIKTSRLVPISIFDGAQLQDAGLYLSRPEPLALAGEVEYQLKQNGATVGLFDVKNAAQEMGGWVGYGEWKVPPAPKHAAAARPQKVEDDEDDEKPVLHRKKHDGDETGGDSTGSGSTSSSSDDPGRPRLHKKDDSGSSPNSPSGTGSSGTGSNGTSSTSAGSDDPDRPVMKKPKKPEEDIGHVDSLPDVSDPDRPRLVRGKDNSQSLKVLPSLLGMPPDMRQTVGVSDVRDKPDHPWSYAWAGPDDEAKMKAALEDQARIALGIAAPAPAKTPASARRATGTGTGSATARRTAKPAPPPAPVELENEQFRVFQLAYDAGATLVLSAQVTIAPAQAKPVQAKSGQTGSGQTKSGQTKSAPAGSNQTYADKQAPQTRVKFVTLVAQPDLYGNLRILLKNVSDSAHLDETPRMILVDAVDALADNRGELLFELRGAGQRQFALYRVLRGEATQIFITSENAYGSANGD